MKNNIKLSVVYIIFSIGFLFGQDNFSIAKPGEYWIILTDNVAVMRKPKAPTSRAAFDRMFVTGIHSNTKVQILETKGFLSVWQKVNVLSDDGILATGWILAEIVESSRKIKQTDNKTIQTNKWGLIRYTHNITNVRESRDKSSKIVTKLKPNQKIKVDFINDGWSAVFKIDEYLRDETNAIGYVYSSLLYPEPKNEKSNNFSNNLLSFKIVSKEDQSYKGTSRMTYRVLLQVSEKPDEQKIKDVALSIWKDGNKSWKEFTVFIYLPEMDTSSIAYGLANFTPTGLDEFIIQEYSLLGTKWSNK